MKDQMQMSTSILLRICMAVAMYILFGLSANAQFLPNKFQNEKVTINGLKWDKYMVGLGGATNPSEDEVVQLPAANAAAANQWFLMETDEANWYRIYHVVSQRFLTINITPPNVGDLYLDPNTTLNDFQQKFKFNALVGTDQFRIETKENGVFVAAPENTGANFTEFILEPNGGDHRNFKLELVPFGEEVTFDGGVDASKAVLLTKSWYIHDRDHLSLLTNTDPDDLGQNTTLDYGPNSQFVIIETDDALWFMIGHRATGKYVTVEGTSPGSPVGLKELIDDGEDESQHFRSITTAQIEWHKLRSRLSTTGNSLNLEVLPNGDLIVNSPKVDPSPEQKFAFNQSQPNSATERYAIVDKKGRFVTDLGYSLPNTGVKRITEADYSTMWNFIPAGNGEYYIQNILTKQYISNGGSTANGAEMKMAETTSENAKWILEVDNAKWRIKNKVSGFYFSTKGENQDEDPLYQAGFNSTGVKYHLIPLLLNDTEFVSSTFNTLQDDVPFPPPTGNVALLQPLLVSIGLPNNTMYRKTVWKAMVFHYESTALAETALRRYNSTDPGHRAEMALIMRSYVVDYLGNTSPSQWCPDEVALVDFLEAEARNLRIDYAERKVAAWEDFEATPQFGNSFLSLVYNNDLDDFESPDLYVVDSSEVFSIFNFLRVAKNKEYQNQSYINLGVSSLSAVGGTLFTSFLITKVILTTLSPSIGGGETITITAPLIATGKAKGAGVSGITSAFSSGISAAAGIVTVVLVAAQVLAAQVQDVIDYDDFEDNIYESLDEALALDLDLHAILNGYKEREKIRLLQDLDYIFSHTPSTLGLNNIFFPDGASFLPQVTCPADQVVYADPSSCTHPAQIFPIELPVCAAGNLPYYDVSVSHNTPLPIGVKTVKYTSMAGIQICSYTITVNDVSGPSVGLCPNNITVNAAAGECEKSVAWPFPVFTDCQAISLVKSHDPGDVFPLGTTAVSYLATDADGNTGNCNFTVTVNDITAPTAQCVQNFTVELDEYGNGPNTFTAAEMDGGTFDDCGNFTLSIDPPSFPSNGVDCSHTFIPKTYTLTAQNANGLSTTCTVEVTTIDVTAPIVTCKDATVVLDGSGSATITNNDIEQGSFDACAITSKSIDLVEFDCSHIGQNTVTLTVSDAGGNSASCTSTVTIQDGDTPTVECENAIVDLGANGTATIGVPDIEFSSFDPCGIVSKTLSQTTFTCADLGTNTVTLTVTDLGGLSSSCVATVFVNDIMPATVNCKTANLEVGVNGTATLDVMAIDDGSFDNCSISVREVFPNTFTCADLGVQSVVLSIIDAEGNIASCNSTVTVTDATQPTVTCKDATVVVDASGSVTITEDDIEQSSFDACAITSKSIDLTEFDCSNVGQNTVTLTVNDASGNSTSCTSTVTVQDGGLPTVGCKNATVNLGADGTATIEVPAVEWYSFDLCGIVSKSLSQNTFTCADLGSNSVTLTVTDVGGLTSSCDAFVNVKDVMPATAICKTSTVEIGTNGTGTLDAIDIDDNSFDNCTIASRTASPNSFTCADIGSQSVELIIIDGKGNTSSCTTMVTVEDNLAPQVSCQDVTKSLNASGNAVVTPGQFSASVSDNCVGVTLSLNQNFFTCAEIGTHVMTLTATDDHGNSNTCSATLTLVDDLGPTVACQDITISLDGTGNASISTTDIFDLNNSSDNCSAVTPIGISQSGFDCTHIGTNNVVLTAQDDSGNTETCTATVTVNEIISIGGLTTTPENCGAGDGSLTVNASASSGQLAYSINGGASWQFYPVFENLTAGNYEVLLRIQGNAGCQSNAGSATVSAVGSANLWYKDIDGDGYTDGITQTSCFQPTGFVASAQMGDCNDYDADEYPGQIWYEDMDGDGYGSGFSMPACQRPIGFHLASELTAITGDCNDDDAAIHPTATEVCNGIDDNCNNEIDEDLSGLTYTGNVNLLNQAQVNAWSECYTVIDGNLTIKNSSIDSLPTLVNLQKVTGNVYIKSTKLDSLSWLLGLDTIGGFLTIQSNNELETLHGLDSLKEVGGYLRVYFNNPLTDCCAIHDLLDNNGVGGSVTIMRNDTGCDNVSQIETACSSSTPLWVPTQTGGDELWQGEEYALMFDLYPNPASSIINIRLVQEVKEGGKATLFNAMGQVVEIQDIVEGQESLSFDMTQRRVAEYIVRVTTERGTKMEKVMVVR